jgi:hypothetical protein
MLGLRMRVVGGSPASRARRRSGELPTPGRRERNGFYRPVRLRQDASEAERLVGPVIVERERWRETARVSEDEILRLRDELAGAVEEVQAIMATVDARVVPLANPCPSRKEWERIAAALDRLGGQ